MMGWAGEVGWAGGTVVAVSMLAFWAVVLYLVATMFRTDRPNGRARTEYEADPLRSLEGRFARGDIDADEFVARRQVLTQTDDAPAAGDRQGLGRD